MTAPPRTFVALAALALLEGVGLIAYATFSIVEAIRVGASGPEEVSNLPAIAVLILIQALFGLGMLWVARGWWQQRRWARAPFVLTQLIALLVGYELAQSAGLVERVSGIGLGLVAIVGLVLSFLPVVTRSIEPAA